MTEPAGQPEVEVERLAKTYPGGTEAVRGISFTVRAGEVFGLLGPNGAGKSTTIGMLTTAIIPTAGRARLAGFDVAAEPIAARRISAAVCQDPAVDRALTLRGAAFHVTVAGFGWFAAAAIGLAVATYGIAETLANRIGEEEEYVNMIPTIGIAPWFFAGSLFPIGYLPGWLAAIAKLLPVTQAVALMRYGLAGSAAGLHAIWGMTNVTQMATLSLLVLALYAVGLTWLAIRVFTRTALR